MPAGDDLDGALGSSSVAPPATSANAPGSFPYADVEFITWITERAPHGILAIDTDGTLLWANARAEERFAPPGTSVVGARSIDFVHPDDFAKALISMELLAHFEPDAPSYLPALYRLRCADGSYGWFELSGTVASGPDGRPVNIAIVRDADHEHGVRVTVEHIAAGDPLADTFAALVGAYDYHDGQRPIAITWTADDGTRAIVGDRFDHSLAASDPDEHPDDPWHVAARRGEPVTVTVDQLRPELQELARLAGLAGCVCLPVADQRSDVPAVAVGWVPDLFLLDTMAVALTDSLQPLMVLALDRRHQLDQLTEAATRDPLTGLLNRSELLERLNLLAAARRSVTVLYCDLDGFKPVNDTHGHAVGDRVLSVIGARIAATTRHDDVTARLGGDEFAIALPDLADVERATEMANRLTAAVSAPIAIEDDQAPGSTARRRHGDRLDGRGSSREGAASAVEIQVGISVGVVVVTGETGFDPDELMKVADQTMYAAKQSGTNRHRLRVITPEAT